MKRIRLLTEQVANQIAAGEVVERPASVVKELVENALDAESTRITVEIQTGGRSLIRVTDDGVGMSRDDALLCLERHATSKISRAEDLESISTMGFRGEALPSIASVSRLTLTTLERGADGPATRVVIHGGKIIEVKEAGGPPGTCLEVRQLFFNLPARRKFLRSDETEYSHIHHYLTLAALACPDVALTFVRDGRTVWQLPSVPAGEGAAGRLQALRQRMRELMGLGNELIAVDHAQTVEAFLGTSLEPPDRPDETGDSATDDAPAAGAPPDQVRVWGFIGQPGLSRSTRQDQHLFVNKRPVENRGLNMALLEGYHTALMKGRYPVCCLFLELHPSRVDVNIHPAKREVKFRNERGIRRVMAEAVRNALLDYHGAAGQAPPDSPTDSHIHAAAPAAKPGPEWPSDRPELWASQKKRQPQQDAAAGSWIGRVHTESAGPSAPADPAPHPLDKSNNQESPAANPRLFPSWEKDTASGPGRFGSPDTGPGAISPGGQHVAGGGVTGTGASHGPIPLLDVPLRLVGVVGRLYVVLESDRGLVLMDQHAAHERILFEQMLRRMEEADAPSQRLLLPETVEVSIRDAQFLREQLKALTRMGVGLSEFGERTFLLDALPPFVKVPDPKRFVVEMVDALKAAGQEVNTHRLGEHTIAKTVCRHAVKANDPLAPEELEGLLADLRRCDMPYTCPHGRPTLIEMSYKELEKRFGRLA